MNKEVELLSPAGDMPSLITAINNGANAVYLGIGSFNARAKATNFTVDNIRDAVIYCHLRDAKVYVTVNTLISDDEMSDVVDLVKHCVDAHVDAYIVQDLGVATVLKDTFPNITLHASTQMGIHNLYGAMFAKEFGFKRIVLSRETTLADIKQIHDNVDIEIEYFVHGALCVAFSGNCYLSMLATGDSGNRGKCQQLCRMRYDSERDSAYYLSTRDLCLIHELNTLIDAGVTSLKIEGRLKRPGYVGVVTSTYRKALDQRNIANQDISNLQIAFNRGDFNKHAYLYGNNNILNTTLSNHTGLKIGKVIKCEKFKDIYRLYISSNTPINAGDGLKFYDSNLNEVGSMGVGNVDTQKNTYIVYTTRRIEPNSLVHKTLDCVLENKLTQINNKVKIAITLFLHCDQPIHAKIYCPLHNFTYSFDSTFTLQPARTAGMDSKEICTQLSKSADSHFDISITSNDIANVFAPKSALNDFRRTMLQSFQNALLDYIENDLSQITHCDKNHAQIVKNLQDNAQLNTPFDKMYVIDENTNCACLTDLFKNDLVILSFSLYSVDTISATISKLEKQKIFNIAIDLPVVANHDDIKIIDDIVAHFPALYFIANNYYALHYKHVKLIAGTMLNIYNTFTAYALKDFGLTTQICCIEKDSKFASKINAYAYQCGNFPAMTLCHCPAKEYKGSNCNTCNKQPDNYCLHGGKTDTLQLRHYQISKCYWQLLMPYNAKHSITTHPVISKI